ncbi:PEP/pyruvate-binding domain-containing protein [Thermodesulforhabdus norvegica]|uniref:Phosphoenolpyruvate synthase n=1 Tax=Thermodesulforhabdus norvegica TaxID=39841 RepID=A0A1I4QY02_9BACT|nr:PEP/pyruvate-binding domain-containing protein [Thermodesulforhabdus norvegica]SFM44962.1 Pyruvate phosphate dikinase, PEP/pyruvate binding domain [Thermodesulforhabdus norvegica]
MKGDLSEYINLCGDLVVRFHEMLMKMGSYPELISEMRALFLEVLKNRGMVADELIEKWVQRLIRDGRGDPERLKAALVDFAFAAAFSEEEIENHINLVRKRDRFRNLWRVVNTEGVSQKKVIKALKEFCSIPEGNLYIDPGDAEGVRVVLIQRFISTHLPFVGVAKKHITIRDVDELIDRTYSSPRKVGLVGGKAAGMILAYRILVPRLGNRDPELEKYLTIPESYYFNSGIFSEFIEYNNLHHFRTQKYRSREEIEEDYRNIAELFKQARFPPDTVTMFADFLEKIGEVPLILRSSSLLEDSFGHAFSGKYDSVFLANQGPLEKRLDEFIWGLKQVHMSTYGPDPILYRRDHGLLDFDEKMSVLVQKVVGRRYGNYFMPFASGVAFSRNMYRWSPRIRKEDGIVRLVLGLGTRAVDRVGGDYARLVPLSHPQLRPEGNAQQIVKYSQKFVDVLNLNTGKVEAVPFFEAIDVMGPKAAHLALSYYRNGYIQKPTTFYEENSPETGCITFDNFLEKTPFVRIMKKVLRKLEQEYGRPVDVEFAWENDRLYLLQCRTLASRDEPDYVVIPSGIDSAKIVFKNNRVLFNADLRNIRYIVFVDPREYREIRSGEERIAVGRIVGMVNRALDDKYALFGPGRWGSNDLRLGVRVGYQDINRAVILGEIAFEQEGMTPEVSFGTHFFNDLIEARIVPVAIFPDEPENFFNESLLEHFPNELFRFAPDYYEKFYRILKIIDLENAQPGTRLRILQDVENQKGIGYLEVSAGKFRE